MAGGFPLMQVMVAMLMLLLSTAAVSARSPETDAKSGIAAFAENCFSPFLTAKKAATVFNLANLRHDFYDLDPFSNVPPSPAIKRPVTPGTDRRCEVAFDLDFTQHAARIAVAALHIEGIIAPADLPEGYSETPGTALLAARQLNPNRIAVVHVGTRPGANGVLETFMFVERLLPLNQ